ncbi:cytochrome d ubiquinol oxidase subunit II [Aneurinibacillus danicus]|jgi:cytochrome d ubiquinol oxidase subunit II|uniref:Cytochrome c oxidase assembly protein n=1 Tax=Aneurinibacillus danicus TaxID=267746 RepID=A0A511V2P2_9BACL|nr:cytochrome d ubiquinol oxidase subunit II [Aneurinibacillus danicus]GEN33139.1 cytochrome c oxidase assembly protein [Aneurinibacillus danicus]
MSHDTLITIWFGLWGLIWTVYFVLDAYALGTGIVFPFLAKNEKEQRQLQEAIGPFWGGNEVWLITAGGATFAAFPVTYALMFSYLYTPLMLILFALFFRATGLEFMHKIDNARWKSFWKWSFFTSSFAIALLFGVMFANLFYGLEIDQAGYHGTLLSLLHPYGLLGGILFVSLFTLSGCVWIAVKTKGAIRTRALKWAQKVWFVSVPVLAIFMVATNNRTPLFEKFAQYSALWLLPVLALLFLLAVITFLRKGHSGLAFGGVSVSIVLVMASGFAGMFPNMLPSRLEPAWSVTMFEAAGSQLNLSIMLGVALVMVPIVIMYQLWLYRIFREKISPDNAKGYH